MSHDNDRRLRRLRRLIQEGFDSENVEFDFEQLNRELDRMPGRYKGQIVVSADFDAPLADAYVGKALDAIEPIDEVVADGEIGQQTGADREDDAVALRRLRLWQKLSLF